MSGDVSARAAEMPPVRNGAAAFIFVTILLDMFALGVILPVLPKLVESFVDNDTAGAARMIAESGNREDAAIASVEAGVNLGLAVLAERIQTEKENFTKFAAIGIEQVDLGQADKTSLVMAVLDNPGSLLASLQPFAERGINLHKLESRPRRGKAFEYVFYVDLMAAADDPDVEAALKEVAQHTSLLRVLGSYRSAGDPV